MIKTKNQRNDESLNKCVLVIIKERMKRDIDESAVSYRRITKAIANLIMTDTEIRQRLIEAILEDDRRK